MEIIAAHSRKENKTIKSGRKSGMQNQVPCLPAHDHSTEGNINTAEYEKVKKFPEQFVWSFGDLWLQNDNGSGIYGVTFISSTVNYGKFKIDCVIFRITLVEITIIQGILKLSLILIRELGYWTT